jgi:hypothetical protein
MLYELVFITPGKLQRPSPVRVATTNGVLPWIAYNGVLPATSA